MADKYTLEWLLSMTTQEGSCLIWSKAVDKDGYGQSGPLKRRFKVHREVAKLSGQDIEGKLVRHACDNPSCINPEHLITGTHLQNVMDRVARGRTHGHVTEEEARNVEKLRAEGYRYSDIASTLKISYKRVEYILTRRVGG